MKKPRAKRRQKPRLEIVMQERPDFRLVVPVQEFHQRIAAKVMHHAGGEIDLPGVFRGKRIAMHELARQIFRACQSSGFLDERGVQIHASQFHALLRQWRVSREPANVVADAATDVDHTQWSGDALAADRRNHRAQQFVYPRAVIELFGEPLHFPVHGHEQAVDGLRVQRPVALRKCFDGSKCLAVPEFVEHVQNLLLAHGKTFECPRIVLHDQIRNFRLRRIPCGDHKPERTARGVGGEGASGTYAPNPATPRRASGQAKRETRKWKNGEPYCSRCVFVVANPQVGSSRENRRPKTQIEKGATRMSARRHG